MNKKLLPLFFLFFDFSLSAQEFITYDTIDFDNPAILGSINFYDLTDCQINNSSGNPAFIGKGLTKASDNFIYVYGPSQGPDPVAIWKLFPDVSQGAFQSTISQDTLIQGMSCDYEGLVYLVGKGVSIFDPNDLGVTYMGDFPDGMLAGGDLTYREGRFFMTTTNNEIVEVDIQNPSNSTIIGTLPDTIAMVQGLATFPYSCDSIDTYAITQHENGSTVYLLDFDNFSLSEHCQYDRFNFDAATTEECILPPCEIFVDLDVDDSSGDTLNGYAIETCLNSVAIADTDIEVFSPFRLDSIRLDLIGILDDGEESINLSSVVGDIAFSYSDTSITIINLGGATEEDFEETIKNIVYENLAQPFTIGEREVIVSMFSSFYTSMPSITSITLDDHLLSLNPTISSPSCFGEENGSVTLQTDGGLMPYEYIWEDGETLDTRSNLIAGTYIITIKDAQGCTNADSLVINQPDSLSVQIEADTNFICGETGSLFAFANGGVEPYSFEWNGQAGIDTLSNIGAGEYELLVIDENDCEATMSITLDGIPMIETVENINLCEGQLFEWENHSVDSDTTVCTSYTLFDGCDSTHCITLNFTPNSILTQSESICEGETYNFQGIDLSNSGVYYDTLSISNQNGCDSILQLNLDVVENPSFEVNISGNLCVDDEVTIQVIGEAAYTYLWSTGEITESIQVSSPSNYELTATSQEGCEVIETITLNENDISFDIQLSNADCNNENGQIIVENIQGGLPPYSYSIDGISYQLISQFDNLPSGQYEVLVEDTEGCIQCQVINLDQASSIEVFGFNEEYEVNLGETVEIQIQTNILNPTISWNPSRFLSCDTCQTVTIQAFENVTYTLLVEDEDGCVSEVEIDVLVDQREEVYIPNAFSPNDDGFNDVFTIYGRQGIENVKSFQIFDRWGALVFEENDQAINLIKGWDGTFNGREVIQGVYVYRIVTERIDGQEKVLNGDVLLIR